MSDIKVRINFSPNDTEATIDYDKTEFNDVDLNNISNKKELSSAKNKYTPFLLNKNVKFKDNMHFVSNYSGVISSENADEIPFDVLIKIYGTDISMVVIKFDKNLGVYATKGYVSQDGYHITVDNDSDIMLFNFGDNKFTELTIGLYDFNVNGKPFAIEGIYFTLNREYGKKEISNLKFGREISNSNGYHYGYTGAYCSFDLLDDGNVVESYNSGYINEKTTVEIFNNENKLAEMYIKNISSETNDSKCTIELNDKILDFDKMVVEYNQAGDTTAYDLLYMIMSYVGIENIVMESDIEFRLRNIRLGRYYQDKKHTISELLNYFCEMALVTMNINANGELEVYDYV